MHFSDEFAKSKNTSVVCTLDSGIDVDMDFLIDGQLCRHFFFLTSGQHEAGNWDPSYAPGVDFLDHDFL